LVVNKVVDTVLLVVGPVVEEGFGLVHIPILGCTASERMVVGVVVDTTPHQK
jgi:hypothetical protein